MTNEKLIQKSHAWALVVFLLFGVIAAANEERVMSQSPQNQNANSNSVSGDGKNANRNMNDDSVTRGASITGQAGMPSLAAADKKFLMEAAMGGMMEVELGRLAAQQGTSESIKQFGQRMVDDHSKAHRTHSAGGYEGTHTSY